MMTEAKYNVFKRRPWKKNPAWPGGWEPEGGARKTTVRRGVDLETARAICAEGNANIKRDKSGSIKPGQMFYEFERQS